MGRFSLKPSYLSHFNKIWLCDFEFGSKPGERPEPVCLVAHEVRSGKRVRIFQDELVQLKSPPYDIDASALFVAYLASAELTCHLSLGWEMPIHVLDLYVEFKNMTNGYKLTQGAGLLGAMAHYGFECLSVAEKTEMRDLVLRGGPWTSQEKASLLEYCESDVVALAKLLEVMLPRIDIPHAILRGRYMRVVAEIEDRGVPIDMEALKLLRDNWEKIKDKLISTIDTNYCVFDGQSFKRDRFDNYLKREKIPWPRLETGVLDLDDDTFKEMARSHPKIAPLRELRGSLSKMRLADLPVGQDGRSRCMISPFQSRTGRNQPSTSKFIFGPSVWLRSLILPQPGFGLAYLDWSQQEVGIAAALSRDLKMVEAYNSLDPYLAFAKQAGLVPLDATKQSHESERDQAKACVLAVQYGMGEESLAARLGQPTIVARHLLRMHRETYPTFWSWSDSAVDHAMIFGSLSAVLGWTIYTAEEVNPRFLRNFPMQGNGSEMLRLACILASERGVNICAPVHDAILIEAPLRDLESAISAAKTAMSDASSLILNGFRLNTDAKVIRYPERYSDKRGVEMWNRVWGLIGRPDFQIR